MRQSQPRVDMVGMLGAMPMLPHSASAGRTVASCSSRASCMVHDKHCMI